MAITEATPNYYTEHGKKSSQPVSYQSPDGDP